MGDEHEHLERLRRLERSGSGARQRRRGSGRQRQRRQMEREVRAQTVRFRRQARGAGLARAFAAGRLGVKERTLRDWEWRLEHGVLLPRALGRPTLRPDRDRRNEVLGAIREVGPGVGVAHLREHFADVARAELAELLSRYRRVYSTRQRQALHVLHWLRAGSVWAMDYSQAPCAIEGCYRDLLAVRDLASGYVLLWLPVEQATARTTAQALVTLFEQCGCPLLMKADNGGHFRAEAVEEVLAQHQVTVLHSPGYVPRYNGSIEAGIGALKTRTHHESARQGRPGRWTCDDVEAARWEANVLAQPWGESGPTPQKLWQERGPISDRERRQFQEQLIQEMAARERQAQQAKDSESYHPDKATRQREAISAALVAQGYLSYTRRRIPLPFSRAKVT